MHCFAQDNARVDLAKLRERPRKMADQQLRQFGNAAGFMCSPEANFGKPPSKPFLVQRREARAEWRRRHPKTATT
jgi:hypothetical protein